MSGGGTFRFHPARTVEAVIGTMMLAGAAQGAQAQDIAAFAEERCIRPMASGSAFDLSGLREEAADRPGVTPQPVGDASPICHVDDATGACVGWLTIQGAHFGFGANRNDEVRMIMAQFEAAAAANDLVIPESCRNLPTGDAQGNSGRGTVAHGAEPTAPGVWAMVYLSEFLDTGTAELLAMEVPVSPVGMDCGELR